jgi:two-component system CheB/CheR fusion protein
VAANEPTNSPPAPAASPDAILPDGQRFLVVGVGASAGGLEAFRELLEEVPPDPGLTFLFAQHLDPSRPSLLRDILSHATPLDVCEARDGEVLEPNRVYVMPPEADMAVRDGHIALLPRGGRRAPHMPIDRLFRSLAEALKERAVGVILSGGGTDGTLGFQSIKAEGGVTFAQDDKSARHDSMPRSAVADGNVDYVLPPAEIGRQLVRLACHPYAAPDATPPAEDEAALGDVVAILRASHDIDFTHYKRTTILRRLRRRMALRGFEMLADYVRVLRGDPAEVHNLHQDLLIRVTRFFRDEEVFDSLKAHVFPALVRDRSANSPIRIWVAGCSTGEEVYSLAIALLEFLAERGSHLPVKILATDVNEYALEKARSGLYLDNIEIDVSEDRLRRFFAKVDGHYQVGKVVRDLCIFSRHNLAGDPPFSHLDLVSCRNVLIYLDLPLQKRIVPVLHYALDPAGFLLLGSSETVGGFTDLFQPVDARHRIFTKNHVPHAHLGLDFGAYVGSLLEARRPAAEAPGATPWAPLDVQREADRVVLARFAPVGVVVDESMTVLQFRGHTGDFLEPAPGMASLDLLKMLREGLVGEVRGAIARARGEGISVRREGLPLRGRDRFRLVNVEVIPIKVPPGGVRCYVVLFSETPAPAPAEGAPHEAADPGPQQAALAEQAQQVQQLQQELNSTREYLQSLIEEHESACEELKSASEELLSANEELQGTNEELQTAKEETQSANEELATLNDELQHRNLELAQANNDFLNLLAAVNIPIVLVSRDLRIRRFTPAAEKVLNLIPTDVGRPFSDLKPNVDVPDFDGLIAKVIETLTPLERETQDHDGRWYSLRIRPYVTLDNKIDGASVTLVDVDSLKRGREAAPTAG